MGPSVRTKTFALILPTLNEVEGLKWALPQIDKKLFDQIIVIDGRSTDGTIEYALENGLTVASQRRPGLQFGIFDIIRSIDCDYVIEFSPDGNCKPDLLPQVVEKLREGADLVVVSRYLEHARSYDDHLISSFGNWMFTKMINALGGSRVTDALNIYRGFRRDIVLSEDFESLLRGPVFEPLVTGFCQLQRRSIIEFPGDEPPRIGGETKRSIIYNGTCVLLMVLRLYLRKLMVIDAVEAPRPVEAIAGSRSGT